jgi:hypothetical protein
MRARQHTLPPDESSIRAAVRLLCDEDPKVAIACRRQILSWGRASRAALEQASNSPDARQRVRARFLLRALDLRDWTDAFVRLVMSESGSADRGRLLLDGVVHLTQVGAPWEQISGLRQRLARLGAELRPLVADKSSIAAARNLASYLAEHNSFRVHSGAVGASAFLLDRVLECRRGHPAALAALYLLVGREAGLRLCAVRFARVFLVRVHGRRNVLIDPVHGGRSVTKADCLRYLRDQGAVASSSRLADLDDVELLGCLVDNLAKVHAGRDVDLYRALRYVRRALARI